MKCKYCGGEIDNKSKTCPFCGSSISFEEKKELEQLNKQGCPRCSSTNISFRREQVGVARNKKGKYGFIDKTGKWIINPQFDWVDGFAENGLTNVKLNGKWGCIDKTGNMVVNPQYDNVRIFKNTIFFKQNDKWGIIDEKGNIVVKPQFDWVVDKSSQLEPY